MATKTEAKRLEAILTRACRTGNYAALDPTTGELCVRMFKNQGWKVSTELGGAIHLVPRKTLTLWEAVELFMKYPETRAKSQKALGRYDQAFINLAAILGKGTALKDLWVPELKEYQVKRLSKGAAPSTVNIELSALSRVFAVMVEMQLVETNPVRLVKRLSTKSNEREVYLSRETVRSIADKCPTWFRPIIMGLIVDHTGGPAGSGGMLAILICYGLGLLLMLMVKEKATAKAKAYAT